MVSRVFVVLFRSKKIKVCELAYQFMSTKTCVTGNNLVLHKALDMSLLKAVVCCERSVRRLLYGAHKYCSLIFSFYPVHPHFLSLLWTLWVVTAHVCHQVSRGMETTVPGSLRRDRQRQPTPTTPALGQVPQYSCRCVCVCGGVVADLWHCTMHSHHLLRFI